MIPRPRRRKPPKMGIRVSERIDCPSHLQWIRGCRCAVEDAFCGGRIEASHVRLRTDGGMGMKPGDNWTIPLCQAHHRDSHNGRGELAFWQKHGLDPWETAKSFWRLSPAGRKYETKQRQP